jgi:hypothetical protein
MFDFVRKFAKTSVREINVYFGKDVTAGVNALYTRRYRPHGGEWARLLLFPQHYLSCYCRNAPRGATALMAASGQDRFFTPTLCILVLQECPMWRYRPQ